MGQIMDVHMDLRIPRRSGKPILDPQEARVRATAETVAALIRGVKEGKDIDLNVLKCDIARKYGLSR